jgi:hypothetical protein
LLFTLDDELDEGDDDEDDEESDANNPNGNFNDGVVVCVLRLDDKSKAALGDLKSGENSMSTSAVVLFAPSLVAEREAVANVEVVGCPTEDLDDKVDVADANVFDSRPFNAGL